MDENAKKTMYIIQDKILDLVLSSFEENSDEKTEAIKNVYGEYDNLISLAPRTVLLNTVDFINFINNLYTAEDTAVKAILLILKEEAEKELVFKPEFETKAMGL